MVKREGVQTSLVFSTVSGPSILLDNCIMQPFHTLKINPSGFKAIPLSQCGVGHCSLTAERQFLAFCKSSLFLMNSSAASQRPLGRARFSTLEPLSVCLSHLPTTQPLAACLCGPAPPVAGEAEVAQKVLEEDRCQDGCLVPVAPLGLLLAQLCKPGARTEREKLRRSLHFWYLQWCPPSLRCWG